MEGRNAGWLRVRGIGRERLARYVSEFLTGAGYRVEESADLQGGQPTSHLVADIARPNPAVPSSFNHLEFRTSPTTAGSALGWEEPRALANDTERSRALRFATELLSNIEQRVALESRSPGRVTKEGTLPPPLAPVKTEGTTPGEAPPTSTGASSSPSRSGSPTTSAPSESF